MRTIGAAHIFIVNWQRGNYGGGGGDGFQCQCAPNKIYHKSTTPHLHYPNEHWEYGWMYLAEYVWLWLVDTPLGPVVIVSRALLSGCVGMYSALCLS